MRKRFLNAAAVLAVAVAAFGCASSPSHQRRAEASGPPSILARYVDADGNVSRAAMEKGMRSDFDAADLDHDGVLQPDEVRAVNEARAANYPAAPRVIDWNANSVVEFSEFATGLRTMFDQLDRNGDDVLTPDELASQGAGTGAGGPAGGSSPSRGHRGGHRGGG